MPTRPPSPVTHASTAPTEGLRDRLESAQVRLRDLRLQRQRLGDDLDAHRHALERQLALARERSAAATGRLRELRQARREAKRRLRRLARERRAARRLSGPRRLLVAIVTAMALAIVLYAGFTMSVLVQQALGVSPPFPRASPTAEGPASTAEGVRAR